MKNFCVRVASASFIVLFIFVGIKANDEFIEKFIFVIGLFAFFELNRHFSIQKKRFFFLANAFLLLGIYSLYSISCLDNANYVLGWLILITISADSFAYITGKIFKGPKLCPSISPSKTISGAIGGFVASYSVAFFSYEHFLMDNKFTNLKTGIIILVISSIVGDLLESKAKRYLRIKDFSETIPGHGGILDRVDSILLVGIVYDFLHCINF